MRKLTHQIVTQHETKVQGLLERLEALKAKKEEEEAKFEGQDYKVQEAQDANKKLAEQEEPVRQALAKAKEDQRDCEANLNNLRDQQALLEKEVANQEAAIKEHQEKIAKERNQESDGARARQQEELARLEIRVREAGANVESAATLVSDAHKKKQAEDAALKKAKSQLQAKRNEVSDCHHRLQTLEKSKSSSLTVYHNNMPAVVQTIDARRSQFKGEVIGPLGMSVKLRKEEWGGICENILGRSLNAFLVTNYEDHDVLKQILEGKEWYFGHSSLDTHLKQCSYSCCTTRSV